MTRVNISSLSSCLSDALYYRRFPLFNLFRLSVKDNKKVLRRTESYSPRRDFVEEKLGSKYVIGRSLDFAVSFEESGPATPMFFILSPGVDPLKDVEKHGNTLSFVLCLISRNIQPLSVFWTFYQGVHIANLSVISLCHGISHGIAY